MTTPDTTTCPRCERKGLRAERIPGAASDSRDPLPSDIHYWCSNCQHYFHPVELRPGRERLDAIDLLAKVMQADERFDRKPTWSDCWNAARIAYEQGWRPNKGEGAGADG